MKSITTNRVSNCARATLEAHGRNELERISPALYARLLMASVGTPLRDRSYVVPNYLSDIGIRQSSEPGIFFAAWLAALGCSPLREEAETHADQFVAAWDGDLISEVEAGWYLDTLVSFAGFWDTARALADRIRRSARQAETARLRTYLGCVLAVTGDDQTDRAFEWVASAVDRTPDMTVIAKVRLAAWQIKKRRDPASGISTLETLIQDLNLLESASAISAGDRSCLEAIALNLRALAELRLGQDAQARLSLEIAAEKILAEGLVTIGTDHRGRYASQIGVNLVQLVGRGGNWANAHAEALRHLSMTRQRHEGSISEATSLAAFTAYRSESLEEAVELARSAELLTSAEGSPLRLQSVRKVLAVALDALGDGCSSQAVIKSIDSDPIGTELLAREDA